MAERSSALPDLDVLDGLVPVKAQLRLPRELALVEDRVAHEAVDDVALVPSMMILRHN